VGLNKSTISGSFFDKEDAVHIACSETTGAVLLTTDDDRVKIKKEESAMAIYSCRQSAALVDGDEPAW